MTKQDTPLFSNNCGKLYRNKVVFNALKESVPPQNIKSISLRKSISLGSLFFLLLPCFMVLFSIFVLHEELFIKLLFIAFGIGLFMLGVFQAKKNHYIHVSLKEGKGHRVKIWHGYVKEADRFVDETRKVIAKRALQQEALEEEQDQENAAAKVLKASHKLNN